ncbi:MAG: GNAT family N-acetyltransferase [Myxococcota bacterium]|nr:GNAT family N-acetyltransferase [Myxococcota bacterium]
MKNPRRCSTCAFETKRLRVEEWHSTELIHSGRKGLAKIVAEMLTEPVTRSLPGPWAGPYSIDRARAWIADRDKEGTTLLVVEKSTGETAGLIILFELNLDQGIEVRLGYLLAESCWGRGLASELIAGFVLWCRDQDDIHAIAGGVAQNNPASKRVLEKAGFRVNDTDDEGGEEEEIMRLTLVESDIEAYTRTR